MSPTLAEILLSLTVAERVALADELYASVPVDWQIEADDKWLAEATCRSSEMDSDETLGLSLDEFVAGINQAGSFISR